MRGVKGFTVKTKAESARRRLAKLAKQARKPWIRRAKGHINTDPELEASKSAGVRFSVPPPRPNGFKTC